MNGPSTIGNQVSAQRGYAVQDMPHDGDTDDQKVNAQASANANQAQKANAASANPKGVGGTVDITA